MDVKIDAVDACDATPGAGRKPDHAADIAVEFNVQRVKDVEIPLFRLEQKVQRLESSMQVKYDF